MGPSSLIGLVIHVSSDVTCIIPRDKLFLTRKQSIFTKTCYYAVTGYQDISQSNDNDDLVSLYICRFHNESIQVRVTEVIAFGTAKAEIVTHNQDRHFNDNDKPCHNIPSESQ